MAYFIAKFWWVLLIFASLYLIRLYQSGELFGNDENDEKTKDDMDDF